MKVRHRCKWSKRYPIPVLEHPTFHKRAPLNAFFAKLKRRSGDRKSYAALKRVVYWKKRRRKNVFRTLGAIDGGENEERFVGEQGCEEQKNGQEHDAKTSAKELFLALKKDLEVLADLARDMSVSEAKRAVGKKAKKSWSKLKGVYRDCCASGVVVDKEGQKHPPKFGLAHRPGFVLFLSVIRGDFTDRHSVGSCFAMAVTVVLLSHMGFGWMLFALGWFFLEADHIKLCVESILCRRFGTLIFRSINPGFVINANIETAGWLNDLLKVMWTRCFRNFIRANVEGIINDRIERKIGWIATHPVLSHLFLLPSVVALDPGPNPPWITGIKTHEPSPKIDEAGKESLFVDIGVMIELRPNIVVALGKFFYFGIRAFSFCGPFRIYLAPVFDEDKMIGDLYLSALHPPLLDYHFNGLLGFLNMACIKVPVNFIVGRIFKFVEYPYHFRIPIQGFPPNMREYMFVPTVPRGLMRVKVLRAENVSLSRTPLLSVWLTRNRPYNIMSLAAGACKVKEKGQVRKFRNFVTEFPISDKDVESHTITVEPINKELGVCTDYKGNVIPSLDIPLKKLVESKKRKLAMKLGKRGSAGKLVIFFQFIAAESDKPTSASRLPVSDNPLYSQAILSLIIHQVKSSEALVSPFVSIVAAGSPASTTTMGPPNKICDFSEHFMFPIHNYETDKVTFSLMDTFEKLALHGLPNHQRSVVHNIKVENLEANDIHEPCDGKKPRGKYYLFGRKTVNIEEFTGSIQVFHFICHPSERHEVTVVAKLYFLTEDLPEYAKKKKRRIKL